MTTFSADMRSVARGEIEHVLLSSVARIVSGGTPRTGEASFWNGKIPWATPKDLSGLGSVEIHSTPRLITEAGLRNSSAELLPENSVLFSSRAPIGLLAINTTPMATNQGFKSFVPDPERLDSRYLFRWLEASRAELQNMGVGATFKEVSKAIVSRLVIPLPSLEEQRRIAAMLDKADELRTKRRQALAHLDVPTSSIFQSMFGDPITNPMGWPMVRVGEALESAKYGSSEKAALVGATPVLRMNNLTYGGQLDLSQMKYLSGSVDEKYLVRPGDVLFNRTNSAELVGKTAVYTGPEPMAYAGYLVRLRTRASCRPHFLGTFMNLPSTKRVLRNMCKSIVGMANINAQEVQTIKMLLPPVENQNAFEARVTTVSQLKDRHHAQLRELDALFASLQHRVFKGEL